MGSTRRITFVYGCTFELMLLALAALLAWLLGFPLFDQFRWNTRDAWIGLAAVIPIALFFLWLVYTSISWLAETRKYLDRHLRPFFDGWSIPQLAIISLIAGVAEEFLFRGLIQAKLAEWIGFLPGLLLASVLFGLVHLITIPYAIITAVMGLYLGVLFWFTDNLLAPVVTHAVYDLFALVYYLRFKSGSTVVI